MRKRLVSIEDNLVLVIERPILEILKIDEDSVLDVTTNGTELIIRPVHRSHDKRVASATKQLRKEHEETLKKLAH